MDSEIVTLNLKDRAVHQKWQDFLEDLDIHDFSEKEVSAIDTTIGIYNDDELVATGSTAGNVLKYVAVCNKGITQGSRFNKIVGELVNQLFQKKIFHVLVFTKLKYSESFQHVGFTELAHSETAAFLENGTPNIEDYLEGIPKNHDQDDQKIAGIVMNANPFTMGHRFLVETAACENDLVYVFVVHTDASLFTRAERFSLVEQGLKDLDNVIVVDGGDYMVSYATFPAYFMPTADDAIRYQTRLDARIFRNLIAPGLNITTRYVGTEPKSRTTGIYNEVLGKELPPQVTLKVIPRKQNGNNEVITATEVRKRIRDGGIEQIKDDVPATTYDFIIKNQPALQSRIEKGMNINGN